MSLLFVLLAAQAIQPPPPIIVTNTVPPPVIVAAPSRVSVRPVSELPPDLVEMRIRFGREIVWEGTLRVGRGGATVTQNRTDSEPSSCEDGSPYARALLTSFSVGVSRLLITREGAISYDIRVSRTRPSAADGCAREGTRTVDLHRSVDLARGAAATLRGDAGLEVEVRRR